MIYFEKIEVINILDKDSVIETVRNYTVDYDRIWIYNKVHHEINQYCSKVTLDPKKSIAHTRRGLHQRF